MRKIIGLIAGGFIGACVGFILGLCVELCSCLLGEGISGEPIGVIVSIIGAIIGFFVGNSIDKEEKEKLEQKKQAEIAYQYKLQQEALAKAERERQKTYNNWKNILNKRYDEIERMMMKTCSPKHIYDKIWKEENIVEGEYKHYFDYALKHHCNKLIEGICKDVRGNRESVQLSLNKIYFLKAAYKNDTRFDLAIKKLDDFCTQLLKPEPQYLLINGYGDFNLPLDDTTEMSYMDNNAVRMINKLNVGLSCFGSNKNGMFDGITQNMNKDFLYNAAKIMWYYAKKKPFNVNKFEEARSLYNKYTSVNFVPDRYAKYHPEEHTFTIGKVEEILAVLYSKNQIGGKGTVQQEREYIDAWLENKISSKNVKECSLFVSGLAWLELYELELEALHKMVQENIQLSAELQERLHFLEVGGTSNIKVYEIKPNKNFVYDSSSENWNASEYDVFFRKVGMKKLKLNYSLAISSWKKTLPLSGGQNASMNDLYCEFQKMIKDFDGEVSCIRTKAKAVDLNNVSYPDAAVFQFTSERNKCLSMLFSCEKFGRNLNITIITLFTPKIGMDVGNMQKYATAIKSNIYVDSFRETILQAVDEVIKEEKNIYDEDESSSSSKKFVE